MTAYMSKSTAYSAMDIAEYIINRLYLNGHPTSNLQLQKILYCLQLIYIVNTESLLFTDYFEAWHYGPIIKHVYTKFSSFGGFSIRQKFDIKIEEPIGSFIDIGIDILSKQSPWELTQISNAEGSPWDFIHNKLGQNKGIIPNKLILKYAFFVNE